jgi:Pyruvate/2-oxoacid:ferredoxin oxidoreductase delta subunit
LNRLHEEGFVIGYHDKAGERVFERAFISFTLEQQVRRRKGTELGAAYGEFWEALSKITGRMPSKTPYYRVLPVESTISDVSDREKILINETIQDTRTTLPIDIISEMVKKEPLIAVSECYCRLARENRGDGACTYPRETCFTFNELAETLIETGLARKVEADEAITIVYDAADHGLIHNVDNCQGELKALCNCCPCCCPAIQSFQAGVRNVNATSRYTAVWEDKKCSLCENCITTCPFNVISRTNDRLTFNVDQCIGCGLWASKCPGEAIQMTLREELPAIPLNNKKLWGNIRTEAISTIVKNKIVDFITFSKR